MQEEGLGIRLRIELMSHSACSLLLPVQEAVHTPKASPASSTLVENIECSLDTRGEQLMLKASAYFADVSILRGCGRGIGCPDKSYGCYKKGWRSTMLEMSIESSGKKENVATGGGFNVELPPACISAWGATGMGACFLRSEVGPPARRRMRAPEGRGSSPSATLGGRVRADQEPTALPKGVTGE